MTFENTIHRSEIAGCTACHDAPCSKACPVNLPAKPLLGIKLDNSRYAAALLPEKNPCTDCDAACEKACVRTGKVPVRDVMTRLYDEVRTGIDTPPPADKNRLKTDLCGIPLENPFLLSSSVVASTYDMCARAFEAGWAGAAFKTICTLDIHEASPRFSAVTGNSGEIIGFKNIEQLSDHSVAENMEIFRRLKQNYPDKFILASIMGTNEAEWKELSGLCEQNGADAVELIFLVRIWQRAD